jgi:hypothetical protein
MVRSTPSRAGVTVNGRWRGRTPLPLENLAFGDYVVRVVSPGHEVAREEFTLSATNASRTISVRLERQRRAAAPSPARGAAVPSAAKPSAPFTGSVFVDSRPRGARVFVDGKEVGTTPLRLAEVGIGSHVVRLELPDHRIWSNSVRVAAGAESRVTGSLEPIR